MRWRQTRERSRVALRVRLAAAGLTLAASCYPSAVPPPVPAASAPTSSAIVIPEIGDATVEKRLATPDAAPSDLALDGLPKGTTASASPAAAAPSLGLSPMATIEAGAFEMGSNDDPDEGPVHRVVVATFEMDVTEVTTAAYQRCVDAGPCKRPGHGHTCNYGRGEQQAHPINCVKWIDAKSFCEWAGRRLPTEEEWEYAARGTTGRTYPWGEGDPEGRVCWRRIGGGGTCPVASYPAGDTPVGLHDMGGNVWEWTASGLSSNYDANRKTDLIVMRGGGWGDVKPSYLRGAGRGRHDPQVGNSTVGFRCAR